MPLNISGLLSSRTFEVQSSDKTFYVHSKILSAHSKVFCSMITGVWEGATERKIELHDWDSDTVQRFVEFLYIENYHISIPEDEDKVGNCNGAGKPVIAHTLTELEGSGAICKKPKDKNVLRAHAKVYALAQYKDVRALRKMALKRLSAALGEIDGGTFSGVAEARVMVDVIQLLDYVYSHTDSLSSSIEPMREIVLIFAAKNIESLMGQREMGNLLGRGGDFVMGLMGKVVKKYADIKKEYADMKKEYVDLKRDIQDCSDQLDLLAEGIHQLKPKSSIEEDMHTYLQQLSLWEKVSKLLANLDPTRSLLKAQGICNLSS